MANGDTKSGTLVRWGGIVVTLLLAFTAFAVQSGRVMAKLDGIEKQLSNFTIDLKDMERRTSFLEGRMGSRNP